MVPAINWVWAESLRGHQENASEILKLNQFGLTILYNRLNSVSCGSKTALVTAAPNIKHQNVTQRSHPSEERKVHKMQNHGTIHCLKFMELDMFSLYLHLKTQKAKDLIL